jgi:hypothetical protein
MFPYNDPQTMLDLHHQRARELSRRATDVRRVREAGAGRSRRFGRWPRRRAEQPARAAVAA